MLPSVAQRVAVLAMLGPASQSLWRCFFDLENNFGNSKAAAKQVSPKAKQRRVARAESPHQRYQRFCRLRIKRRELFSLAKKEDI